VRHKCLVCPDFDYCSSCKRKSTETHRGHRFASIFDPIPIPYETQPVHYAIYCDGPICEKKKSYIRGVRYKCSVCEDLDFCASCEALPNLNHNVTHPLIKIRSPLTNCTVDTYHDGRLLRRATNAQQNNDASVVGSAIANAAIQTIIDVEPSDSPSKSVKERMEIKDLVEPAQEKSNDQAKELDKLEIYRQTVKKAIKKEVKKEVKKVRDQIKVKDLLSEPVVEASSSKAAQDDKAVQDDKTVKTAELAAYFICDTVKDGSIVPAGSLFLQTWTLKNPGPLEWPAGCRVRYVGGDHMFNIDDSRPSPSIDISKATSSNVINRVVKVDEEVSFRVVMKAPKREGTSISYWRLKDPNGVPFGHRLWCHITVRKPITAFVPKAAELSTLSTASETAAPAAVADKPKLPSLDRGLVERMMRDQITAVNRDRETKAPVTTVSSSTRVIPIVVPPKVEVKSETGVDHDAKTANTAAKKEETGDAVKPAEKPVSH
jgi:next to BRCA1 gene 1 protein